jgi:hypothetical protein
VAADPSLADLPVPDLHALRLAAQVLQHKAALDQRPLIADYFQRLAEVSLAELAARGEGVRVLTLVTPAGLPDAAPEQRRLLAEYLGLLIANERLSGRLRATLRGMRARDCR